MQGSGHAPPRFAVAILLAAALAVLAGPARADQTFTFVGHGYGHGVGMPQYGAQGYAVAGGTYQQILALYYPGTQIGSTAPNAQIRVLVQRGQASVQVASGTGLSARDEASGATVAVPSAAVVTQASGTYTVSSPDGVPLAAGWAGPVLLSPAGTSPVELVGNGAVRRRQPHVPRSDPGRARRRAGSPRSTSCRSRTTSVASCRARCPRAGSRPR